MGRAFWLAAGAGAGLYGAVKARRLVYRVSPAGLADQVAALRLGAQEFLDDVRAGARDKEAELTAELAQRFSVGPRVEVRALERDAS
jgi:hypothetical protein